MHWLRMQMRCKEVQHHLQNTVPHASVRLWKKKKKDDKKGEILEGIIWEILRDFRSRMTVSMENILCHEALRSNSLSLLKKPTPNQQQNNSPRTNKQKTQQNLKGFLLSWEYSPLESGEVNPVEGVRTPVRCSNCQLTFGISRGIGSC